VGIAVGSVLAAARVRLRQSLDVLPVGVVMGVVVTVIAVLNPGNLSGSVTVGPVTASSAALIAGSVMVLIGALAGYFVVPMNALLQHRGHVLLSAGHSIAVQNFNENLSILVMLSIYALLLWLDLHINVIIVLFGAFVSGAMLLVQVRHRHNQRQFDSVALIPDERHH
jgi:LPLT family lysophospholipid transporter-like MFS transporter